jgi:hypothetical protein
MVCYPALYLCRHSLEPYLKDALPRCPNPQPQVDATGRRLLRSLLRDQLNTDIPKSSRDDLYAPADIDPDGQSFRYVATNEAFSTICSRRILDHDS